MEGETQNRHIVWVNVDFIITLLCPPHFKQDLKKRCSEYQQVYDNLAKDKFENKLSDKKKKLTLTMKIKSNLQIFLCFELQ